MCHISNCKIEMALSAYQTLVHFEQANLRMTRTQMIGIMDLCMTCTQMIGITGFISRPCIWKTVRASNEQVFDIDSTHDE